MSEQRALRSCLRSLTPNSSETVCVSCGGCVVPHGGRPDHTRGGISSMELTVFPNRRIERPSKLNENWVFEALA